jgi:hypothetical protein
MDPARMFTESLTPCSELENNQGQAPPFADVCSMSGLPPKADLRLFDHLVGEGE